MIMCQAIVPENIRWMKKNLNTVRKTINYLIKINTLPLQYKKKIDTN